MTFKFSKRRRVELDRVTLTQAEMTAVLVLIDKVSGGSDCNQVLADLHWKLRTALLRNVRLRQVAAGTYQPGTAQDGA